MASKQSRGSGEATIYDPGDYEGRLQQVYGLGSLSLISDLATVKNLQTLLVPWVTTVDPNSGLANSKYRGVVRTKNKFVAIGSDNIGTSTNVVSKTGLDWAKGNLPVGNWGVIGYDGTTVMAQIIAAGTGTAISIDDGLTWVLRAGVGIQPDSLAGNGAIWVSVGGGGCQTSEDGGATWVLQPSFTFNGAAVRWIPELGLFVAVGTNAAATSPDGKNWTNRVIPNGTYFDLDWNGSLIVAIGANVVATTPDGITWTARVIPAGGWSAVRWVGTFWFAAGNTPNAASSTDGITWILRQTPSPLGIGVPSSYPPMATDGNALVIATNTLTVPKLLWVSNVGAQTP